MAVFRPFRAIRPQPALAAQVAALPYDTMSSAEARQRTQGNPLSFLHVDKAEIDLPEGTGLYDAIVYETAAANLQRMQQEGVLVQDAQPQFYIYRQSWRGHVQTGLVGCASISDYQNNVIKKHELTRAEKEADRIRHVSACNANTGPIFLAYKDSEGIADWLDRYCSENNCESRFEGPDNALQEIWPITDFALAQALQEAFARMESLYIADGHHRCASAYQVGLQKRAQCPGFTGEEEFNFFLAVAFPQQQLTILDYNRLVHDLNGLQRDAFLAKAAACFEITPVSPLGTPFHPQSTHTFGMLLGGQWYRLQAKPDSFDPADPVGSLDVEILQRNLLAPILGIADPRTDERIEFIGGIRGLEELERRTPEQGAAFAMFPTAMEELMAIADSGSTMPPKSTWFEPKLLSGLFIHALD